MSDKYNEVYLLARNGFSGDSNMWEQIYEYVRQHPNELFVVVAPRKWSLAHQLVFHGAIATFEKILHLYNEQTPIDIFTLGKDVPQPKTILDIAADRKGYYPKQFEYIAHLCDQDRFIRACRAFNWAVIDEMLKKCPQLLNEKPPYCSNYFVHHLVLHNDAGKFTQYNREQNRLRLDLKNADNKTPLELARQINASNIVAVITAPTARPEVLPRTTSILARADERLERDESDDERFERDEGDDERPSTPAAIPLNSTINTRPLKTADSLSTGSVPPTTTASQSAGATASRSTASVSPATTASQPSGVNASRSTAGVSQPIGTATFRPPTTVPPATAIVRNPIDTSGSLSSACIPIEAVITRATCLLTGKIFEDPVIATDGITYERSAIMKHHRENRYSPATGEILDDIFNENTYIKHLIETLREENAIP